MSRAQIVVVIMLALVVSSAIAVVYTKHASRVLFADLQRLMVSQDALRVEWRRLQLEQSTLGAHSRIEQLARERLEMTVPGPDRTRVLLR